MQRWPYYAFYGALMSLLFVGAFVFIVGESFVRGNAPDHSVLIWTRVVVGLLVVSLLGGIAVAGIFALGDWLEAKTRSRENDTGD